MEDNDVVSMLRVFNESMKSEVKDSEVTSELIENELSYIKGYKLELEKLTEDIKSLELELNELEDVCSKEMDIYASMKKRCEEHAAECRIRNDLKSAYTSRLMKARAGPSSTDHQILKSLERKVIAYKKLTGVTWDFFSSDEHHIEGYITHGIHKDKIKLFNIRTEEKSPEEIASTLWKKIEKFNENN